MGDGEITFAGWLLIAGVLLMLIDIFFASDVPTHLAYILFSTTVFSVVDLPLLPRLIVSVLSWFGFVGLHYLVWRKVVEEFSNRFVAPTHYRDGAAGLVGQQGRIEAIEGRQRLRIGEDLWSFRATDDQVSAGDEVTVVHAEDGILTVRKQER